MRTVEEAKRDLLAIMPYLRFAIEEANKGGRARLGILREDVEGGGKIECRFSCEFLEDVALLIEAPPMTEEDRLKAKASQFRSSIGLS
jgi:hypothetical protein